MIPHLGLGDQLVMNGFVHYLLEHEKPSTLCILAKEDQKPTLLQLYKESPAVEIVTVKGDEEVFGPQRMVFQMLLSNYREKGFTFLPFGVYTGSDAYLQLDPCWANCFYAQYNVPLSVRFDFFRLPSNLERSRSVYQKLVDTIGRSYIVLHDDPPRNLVLDYNKCSQWIQSKNIGDIPVVYLGKDRYLSPLGEGLNNPKCSDLLDVESIMDYVDILRNARAALMMDSSLAILLDLLRPSDDQHRLSFLRNTMFPTKKLYQSKWDFNY